MQQIAARPKCTCKPANRFVAEFLGIANFVGLEGGRTGLVRPERVRLGTSGVSGGRAARVIEVIYLGQMVRYHLALERQRGRADGSGGAVRWPGLAGGEMSCGFLGCGRHLAGIVINRRGTTMKRRGFVAGRRACRRPASSPGQRGRSPRRSA